jgi:hypothetical protein
MKHLFQSITIANTSLLIMAIFMTSYLVLPFFSEQIKYPLPLQKTPAKPAEDGKSEFLVPSPADYTIISEENLFHPERIIPPEKKVEQELPKPDFILYGTMVSDDISLAFLEDLKSPRNTPGRGKRQVALKKGDIFSGFTLKEIDTDKIVMVRGGENIMVSVVDPQKPKTREIRKPLFKQRNFDSLPQLRLRRKNSPLAQSRLLDHQNRPRRDLPCPLSMKR